MKRASLTAGAQRLACNAALVLLASLSSTALTGCSPAAPAAPARAPEFPAGAGDLVRGLSFQAGQAIEPIVLPRATGGTGTFNYSLRGELPPGLTFDAGRRELRGTPGTEGTYPVTYEAADANGTTARLAFSIVVATASQPPETEEGSGTEEGSETGNTTKPPPPPKPKDAFTYRGQGDQVFILNPDWTSLDDTAHILSLGSASAEVYVIATNSTFQETSPEIMTLGQSAAAAADVRDPPPRPAPNMPATAKPRWIVALNNSPPPHAAAGAAAGGSAYLTWRSRQASVEPGDPFTFTDTTDGDTFSNIVATARSVVTDGSTTATFWVGDNDWGAGCSGKGPCVTEEMVNAMANRFLRAGAGNDMYDWVTAVYGVPWGPHGNTNLIPAEAAQQIHVLLYDIGGDGAPEPGQCRTGGFFSARHNRLNRTPDGTSAERLTLVLDSVLFAIPEGETWEVTDRWPSVMISALAHEFQHMIHYYQKAVLRGAASKSWLNEMASEVAQDLVADKLMTDGPRGVAHDDPTAGAPGTERGRLRIYNLFNDIQVTAFRGTIADYAIAYAFGAYLARTYGAELFQQIVQSNQSGVTAVEAALQATGHEVSFGQVLADWAVATVLSDNTGAPAPYRYNPGTWATSQAGGVTFRLGSINLYHYRFEPPANPSPCIGPDVAGRPAQEGPYLHSLSTFHADPLQPHSNRYAALGRHTGTVQLQVSTPADTRITLVVKQ